jgi:hypothetical protein
MQKNFAIALAVGLGVIAVIVGGVLFMQRDIRIGLAGNFLKVRTAPLDENSSIAIIDFRFRNHSDRKFIVGGVTVVLDDADGKQYDGRTISESDAKNLFQVMPILGQKYNDSLIIHQTLAPQAAGDQMIAARFEAPEARLAARKRFIIRIEDVDGNTAEISEK